MQGGEGGRRQSCTITLLHMNRLNKTESAIFVSLMYSLLPEDLHSELGAPVAQWVKLWPTDLADRVRSSLGVKSSQP